MTAPMAAWMVFRDMPRRAIVEMSLRCRSSRSRYHSRLARDPALRELALLEHGLMMPAMLAPCSSGSTSTPEGMQHMRSVALHEDDLSPAASS